MLPWTPDPSQLFLAAAKSGDLPALCVFLDPPNNIDVNVRGLLFSKGRLLGMKICPDRIIMSASSQERLQCTATLLAALGLKLNAFGYLMARGGDAAMRCGNPPHLPHEPNVAMILSQFAEGTEEDAATAAHMTRLVTFFNVWRQVPFDSEKKVTMLARGAMESCEDLRVAVAGYVMDVRAGGVKPYVAVAEGTPTHTPEVQGLLAAINAE